MSISDLLFILEENGGVFKDSTSILNAEMNFDSFMKSRSIPEADYETYVNSVASEREKQGFVNGFRLAVGLLTDNGGAQNPCRKGMCL